MELTSTQKTSIAIPWTEEEWEATGQRGRARLMGVTQPALRRGDIRQLSVEKGTSSKKATA